MSQAKTAGDIMIAINDYSTIAETATIFEAIKALRQSFHRDGKAWYGHRSVVVLDSKGKLTGILSLRGLLRAAGFRELDEDIGIKSESWGWYYTSQLREDMGIKVRDVMRPIALATVRQDTPVSEVALSLLRHKVNSLPVFNGAELVGIVRTIDIFMIIGEYFK
ncbi:MAG: CBS domain-containing protein [Desulfocucumaceae bacterium]